MKLSVAIIEDEPATARNLAHFLQEAEPSIEILATLPGVSDAVAWLKHNQNNCVLLFMDIRLNDGLSFEIFHKINICKPVIFVTAYDEYALQAFKAGGIDYLLKPFEATEVAAALEKFKRLGNSYPVNTYNQLALFTQGINPVKINYRQSFLVHYRNKLIPVAVQNIAWFYTSSEIVYAYTTDNKNYVMDFTLEQLQEELNPQQFFRANRQYIIHRNAIQEIEFFFNGRLVVKVNPASPENIIISKARAPEFKQWMNH